MTWRRALGGTLLGQVVDLVDDVALLDGFGLSGVRVLPTAAQVGRPQRVNRLPPGMREAVLARVRPGRGGWAEPAQVVADRLGLSHEYVRLLRKRAMANEKYRGRGV